MAWRDELRAASFRGVEFLVSSVEGDYGRRLASHEYPSRDDPYLEDMGRKARDRTIEAYVLEPDHVNKARDLVDACEKAGPGTLIHPWIGEMQAVCTQCRQTFSAEHGGMTKFWLSFTEAGQARYPESTENAAATTDIIGLSADEANLRQLAAEFDVANMPDYISEDGIGMLGDFAASVKESIGPAIAYAETAAKWAQGVGATIADAQMLVRNPLALGQRILGVLDLGNVSGIQSLSRYSLGIVQDAISYVTTGQLPMSWRQYLSIANWTPQLSAIGLTTPTRIQQDRNRAALVGYVRRSAIVQASRAAVREKFETQQDAILARDTIADLIDREVDVLGNDVVTASPAVVMANDDVFRSHVALRARVVRALGVSAPLLPAIVSYTPESTLPAVVIANRLYGDDPTKIIGYADSIVTRNSLRHPLFAPGGVPLAVLTTTR